MSISKIVCFVSTVSTACRPVIEFCKQNAAPVIFVRLDTTESRQAALQGDPIVVTSVPTLIVEYEDGNYQQFQTAQKIIAWLTQALKRPPPPEPVLQPSKYDTIPHPSIPEPGMPRRRYDTDVNQQIGQPEFEPAAAEEVPFSPEKKDKKKKKKKRNSSPSRSPAMSPVGEDTELIFEPAVAAQNKINKPDMKSIKSLASQMEKERKDLFDVNDRPSHY